MSASTEAVNQPTSRRHAEVSTATLALLCACFLLSGVAALIYQTAWTRQFAIVFGTSELAVATVLAAYMGGLALGAWLAERFLPRVTRPVLTYALLEIGIALSAVVAVPLLLWLGDFALHAMFGGQAAPPSSERVGTTLFYLVSAFVALALPTTLMGATLPMLARYAVAQERHIGQRIGLLYAVNTAGAVVGALLTAFALLPALGLRGTVWVGALFNGVVFLLAVSLARRVARENRVPMGYHQPPVSAPVVPVRESMRRFPGPAWVLPLMLCAGAVAFFQEVLWSRMLAHVVGSSIYAFGVMVASFLTGIALGGGAGALLAGNRVRAVPALAIALLLAAVSAAAAYLLLERLLPGTAGLMQNVQEFAGLSVPLNSLFAGLLLLPMTFCIGMTYPLAVRILAADSADAAPASARVYAWNTVGAILGSLGAGFVLIPALRYEGATQVAVLASATLAVLAAWVLRPRIGMPVFAMSVTLIAVAGGATFRPAPPMKLLVTSPLNVNTSGEVLYYEIGHSASVVVLQQDGGLALRTNGLPEALMDSPGSAPRFSGEYWLSPLAVIARPKTRDMLIVGFGGGVVVEGVPPSVRHIDVIELEPLVIEANRATSALRRRNPLADTRLNIIANDARGALTLTDRRYDAIVSQPSHPWTAGASHLYTREFMQLARSHLNPGGVFVQWMNVIFMDEALLRSLTATLLSVFPEVRVYRPDPNTLVFLASDAVLDTETQLARSGLPLRDAPLHYARFGINNAEDLAVALTLDTTGARQLASGAPLITDDDNRIATSSVYEHGRGMSADATGRVLAAYDPLQRADSFLYAALREQLSFSYIVRRAAVFAALDKSSIDRVARIALLLGSSAEAFSARAMYFRLMQQPRRAQDELLKALDRYPDSGVLRYEYVRPWIGALVHDRAPAPVAAEADKLTGFPAALLAASRHAAESEWAAVAELDSMLADAQWSDPWYNETLELRANWRSRVTNPDARKRFGEEAVAMIDRLAVTTPTVALYGLRTRAGLAMDRPDIVVESAWNYTRAGIATRAPGADPLEIRRDLEAILQIVDDASRHPRADVKRISEVRAQIVAALPP